MTKDKYDFINELLLNTKLSSDQRERILLLSSAEIKRDKEHGLVLEERVHRLEEKISFIEGNKAKVAFSGTMESNVGNEYCNKSNESNLKGDEAPCSLLPKYINPGTLYKFLFEYNQNPVLKSTCHEIDTDALKSIMEYCKMETYDFQKHLVMIKDAFENHDKRYYCIPSTKALIRGYITGMDYYKKTLREGWSSDKIKISWNHSELLDWAVKNRIPPNSNKEFMKENKIQVFGFNGFTSNLFGKRVQTFRELVLHFKCLFHIRSDNSLNEIIIRINNLKFFSNKIEFIIDESTFPTNIELFTDVDKLIQGYIKIIELIIEQHRNKSKPKVKLSFYEVDRNVCFSIHHLNNCYNKSIKNTIERMGQTYTNLVNKQINGLCNLLLRADFGQDGIAEINLWNGQEKFIKKEGLGDFAGGVEHIFEFCKNDIS